MSTDIAEPIDGSRPGITRPRVDSRFRFDADTVGLRRRAVGMANGRLGRVVEAAAPFDSPITPTS